MNELMSFCTTKPHPLLCSIWTHLKLGFIIKINAQSNNWHWCILNPQSFILKYCNYMIIVTGLSLANTNLDTLAAIHTLLSLIMAFSSAVLLALLLPGAQRCLSSLIFLSLTHGRSPYTPRLVSIVAFLCRRHPGPFRGVNWLWQGVARHALVTL